MSNQIVISSGAKVRELNGVLTGTSGVVNALGINVPSGIPQLDGSGKILVSQLPNSVMEYKGTWNAATNTPTLADGTGNQGDVYLCNVAGTVNFGSGPIAFFVGDQVIYSGTIWQRASGATGTVTSVAVTESGDALTITGSPITTSGTINIGFAGNSGQYVNGAGGLTTFPTDNITGSGLSGQVTYFNGPNTITGENAFNYDASNNRLGVNTTVPNATIGANAGTDSGYSLLLKNDNANYNGIGFGTDSTYGNLLSTEKLGTAPARNLTLLNQSGYISITEVGNLGVNILNPNAGIDIYNSTSSQLWLHTANSGISATDGVRLALFSNNGANLRNFEGAMSITSEGDFQVITLGAENIRVNSANGFVGIGNPTTLTSLLTVNGAITQSSVLSSLLKTNASGTLVAAIAGTDYVVPSALSAYVPYTGATTNVNLGTFDLTADVITGATGSFASSGSGNTFAINHSSGSGIALNITKGGNGEGLYINKTSGSGNAATIIGTLNATTIVKDGGTSSQYLMADGSVTTSAGFITGSGVDGRVPYFNGTSSITSEAGFIYDASTNRLGVNTSVPNATIGADAALNSGYGLLIKTGSSNYNGIGIAIDSTYGNTIETAKLGTASARNLTLLNQSGFVSLTESGAFGVGILTPNNGIDIYNSTQSQLWLHNNASGLTATDGVRLALFNNLSANLRNFDGGLSLTAEGDFQIITIGAENLRVNSANGFVGIGNPATLPSMLTVNGGATITSLTTGQVLFPTSGGTLSGSSSLFWDNTNAKLGIGTSTLSGARVTITSTSDANHLQLVSNAPALTFINAISFTHYATVGMATANNNFITGAVLGDLVLGAYNTNNIWFTNANTNTVRMRLDSDGGGTFSGFVSASGPKSQIRVNGNSVGCGISLTNTIVGSDRRNWGIFTEQNVAGDFAIKCSTASGGSAESGNTRLAILSDGNVGIGTSSPSGILHVQGVQDGVSGKNLRLSFNGTYYAEYTENTIRVVNNDLIIGTGSGSEKMRITTGGNVGIGTSSPTALDSGGVNLQIKDRSALFQLGAVNSTYLSNNVYYDGSWKRIVSGYGALIRLNDDSNGFSFLTTGTGGANSAVTFTSTMNITNAGNVGINRSAGSNVKLYVTGDSTTSSNFVFGCQNSAADIFLIRNDGLINLGTAEYSPYNYDTTGRTPILQSNGLFGYLSSTRESKTNIQQLSDISWLYQLNPVSFNYRKKDDEMNYTEEFNEEKWYGLIADEVEKVNEDLVFYNIKEDGTKQLAGVEYNKIIAALIKSSQEQQAQIEELKELIKNK